MPSQINSCHVCGSLSDNKTYDLKQWARKLPEALKELTGWERVPLFPEADTNVRVELACPACAARFEAQLEWFEYLDWGIPARHELTIKRDLRKSR